MELNCRYYSLRYTAAASASEYRQRHRKIRLSAARTALVLVDTWEFRDMEEYTFVPGVPRRDYQEIYAPIVLDRIRPALEAARRLGLTVAYLPSGYVAERYPRHRLRVPRTSKQAGTPGKRRSPAWPPGELVDRRSRQYFMRDRYGEEAQRIDAIRRERTYIHSLLEPRDGEFVLANREELHHLLAERGIADLLYCGFALNMCLLDKPGAIRDMSVGYGLGYRCILLRDCTAAAESNHSIAGMLMTRCWIEWYEMAVGYSTTSRQLIAASRGKRT